MLSHFNTIALLFVFSSHHNSIEKKGLSLKLPKDSPPFVRQNASLNRVKNNVIPLMPEVLLCVLPSVLPSILSSILPSFSPVNIITTQKHDILCVIDIVQCRVLSYVSTYSKVNSIVYWVNQTLFFSKGTLPRLFVWVEPPYVKFGEEGLITYLKEILASLVNYSMITSWPKTLKDKSLLTSCKQHNIVLYYCHMLVIPWTNSLIREKNFKPWFYKISSVGGEWIFKGLFTFSAW